jgi:hypothetical protein
MYSLLIVVCNVLLLLQCTSRYDGDLVAKCYYAKRKLVWEVLESSLKSKMEVQWSDISGIRASFPEDEPAILDIEASNMFSFVHVHVYLCLCNMYACIHVCMCVCMRACMCMYSFQLLHFFYVKQARL